MNDDVQMNSRSDQIEQPGKGAEKSEFGIRNSEFPARGMAILVLRLGRPRLGELNSESAPMSPLRPQTNRLGVRHSEFRIPNSEFAPSFPSAHARAEGSSRSIDPRADIPNSEFRIPNSTLS